MSGPFILIATNRLEAGKLEDEEGEFPVSATSSRRTNRV